MLHKNGNWVWVLARGKINTWTPDGKPLLMFVPIKTSPPEKKMKRRYNIWVTHDELTDLPSLKLLRDRLSIAFT